jgi:hypothetical protein
MWLSIGGCVIYSDVVINSETRLNVMRETLHSEQVEESKVYLTTSYQFLVFNHVKLLLSKCFDLI